MFVPGACRVAVTEDDSSAILVSVVRSAGCSSLHRNTVPGEYFCKTVLIAMPRFVPSQPPRGVHVSPATAVSVPAVIRPVTALRDLKVTLEPVSVRGRVCFLGGAADAFPCRRLRLTDGTCCVAVKSGAPDVWTNLQLDSYVELRNVTVHPAWRGVAGQLELHYHADGDSTDGKRRRLPVRQGHAHVHVAC